MIDIIIPTYNAKDTLYQTLLSINMQTIKDLCKIYIVNDGSDTDYSDEIDMFKGRMNITEIKLTKNSGPGIARQIGINSSNSEYIIFIDADDEFYDCFSLECLLKTIENSDYDIVSGNILEISNKNLHKYVARFNVLHSKLYRRKYIKDNGIIFPNLYHSEDVAFNELCKMFKPKIGYCDYLIYTYKRRENSLTFNNTYYLTEHIKYYIQCEIWAINRAEENNATDYEIGKIAVSVVAYLYYYFFDNMEDETIKYIYCFMKYYNKYAKFVDEEEKNKIIDFWIEKINKYPLDISFNEFVDICEKNYELENK